MFGRSGGGVYSLIASKVTDYYLCARAFRNDLHNDAAYAYLAMLLDANMYVSKGQVSVATLYDIAEHASESNHSNVVDFLVEVITALEVQLIGADHFPANPMPYIMAVHDHEPVIRQTIIDKLSKRKPGMITMSAAKAFYENGSANVRIAERLARETDVYF